ncbi:MAG: sulfatase-like hydrolase/transferase [Gemmataceae bacterium]
MTWRALLFLVGFGLWLVGSMSLTLAAERPNIILCMSDDQGWGDVGYNGHPILKTPHLDAMSKSGWRFDRFYAPTVCSPTRGSVLTGRHPYRYGIFHANVGHLSPREITLATLLKKQGYATGHFGKWHLGTLTKTEKDGNRGGPAGAKAYAPPWEHGFDVCFSTESKVPTWDPLWQPKGNKSGTWWDPVTDPAQAQPYGTAYWANGKRVTTELRGDDSRIIMDEALPFLRGAVKRRQPFFAVIWFHAPHLPVVAGPEYTKMYEPCSKYEQHYYGCITAMDEQIGRLRRELRQLGVADDTMLWFCSDNGPEGRKGQAPGSEGPFRGRKRDLTEGGIRVPGLLEWPARIPQPRVVSLPCGTVDYLPTILELLDISLPTMRPLDGVSLMPLLDGQMTERPRPLAFELGNQAAWLDNRYKLFVRLRDKQITEVELYDIIADPGETRNLADQQPDLTRKLRAELEAWRASCRSSWAGEDYR